MSPYIAGLALNDPWVPMVVFGVFSFTSGILVFAGLPETLGKPLPESVQEALNAGDNRRLALVINAQDQDLETPNERTPLVART